MPPPAKHLLLCLVLLVGCGQRPPWADGRLVREPAPAEPVVQDLGHFEQHMLAAHNRERAAAGAAPLAWDPALAAAAASYGPALSRLGKLAHSEPSTRPGQGENLFMGTRGAYRLDEMVGGWAGEKRLFRPGIFPDVSISGHWEDVAHYTQMIWPATRRVGCAVYKDSEWDFLVCRYAPAGNVVGEPIR
ncbi:MAG TPA: CAP domain-containing protein [Allosphingosinicella sp.]|nr:CAP domain-containing protein [Allosphingosinicella sp.]